MAYPDSYDVPERPAHAQLMANLVLHSDFVASLSGSVAKLLRTGRMFDALPWEIEHELRLVIDEIYLQQAERTTSRKVYVDCLDSFSLSMTREDSCVLRGDVWMFADQFSGFVVSSSVAQLLMPKFITNSKATLSISLTPLKKDGTDKTDSSCVQEIASDWPIEAEVFCTTPPDRPHQPHL